MKWERFTQRAPFDQYKNHSSQKIYVTALRPLSLLYGTATVRLTASGLRV